MSKKPHHKKGLVEWLKVKTLSSNSSTAKKKKIKLRFIFCQVGCQREKVMTHSVLGRVW
jgi:hypothetical protein